MTNSARTFILVLVATSTTCWTGCSSGRFASNAPSALRPFASDGRSLFPDGTFSDSTKWQECCVEHDLAYWQGGTEQDRRNADSQLMMCILEQTADSKLVGLIYNAVRAWGTPAFPASYRWGYGWSYGRGYRALTEEERKQVKQRLKEHYDSTEFRMNDEANNRMN